MKEVRPIKETIFYSVCPNCNKKGSSINHLIKENIETKWFCDNCGIQYNLKIENGKMFTSKTDNYKIKTLVMLKNNNIALIVEGMCFYENKGCCDDDYFYNEHTCPVNYMRNVKMVIDLKNLDNDPHGIFEYVTTVNYDERIEDCNCDMKTLINIFKINNKLLPIRRNDERKNEKIYNGHG
jgi:transcription elongation factor Elf1